MRNASIDIRHLQGDIDDPVAMASMMDRISGLDGVTPPLKMNRMAPLPSTYEWWSRLPVSGPE